MSQGPRRVIALLGAGLLGGVASSLGATGPSLSCSISSGQDVSQPGGPPTFQVSNLSPVAIILALPVSSGGNLLEPMTISDPSSGFTGNVTLIANRLVNGSRAAVPVVVKVGGRGQRVGMNTLSVSLEVPISAAAAQQEIGGYLDRLAAQAQSQGATTDYLALTNSRAVFVTQIQQLIVENQVGTFEFLWPLSSKKTGYWNGTLQAGPCDIVVTDNGRFVDQPGFKLN